jgi:hypothetical protein
LGELTNVCFGAVKFKKSVFGRPTALEKAGWPEWARSTHSPVKEAALQLAYRLNGGNLRDTGHSPEATPTAAMADEPRSEMLPSVDAIQLPDAERSEW